MDIHPLYCTICGVVFDHLGLERIKKHKNLPVPVCAQCFDDFNDKLRSCSAKCAWCGEEKGEKGFLCDNYTEVSTMKECDTCEAVFCEKCIVRNLGGEESKRKIKQLDFWECPCCDLSVLAGFRRVLEVSRDERWLPPDVESTMKLVSEQQLVEKRKPKSRERWMYYLLLTLTNQYGCSEIHCERLAMRLCELQDQLYCIQNHGAVFRPGESSAHQSKNKRNFDEIITLGMLELPLIATEYDVDYRFDCF
jgi:hypothetical protein